MQKPEQLYASARINYCHAAFVHRASEGVWTFLSNKYNFCC